MIARQSNPAKVLMAMASGDRGATRMSGYRAMRRSGLPSGTVYPALRRLHEEGLVDMTERPNQRWYTVSDRGYDVIRQWRIEAAVELSNLSKQVAE